MRGSQHSRVEFAPPGIIVDMAPHTGASGGHILSAGLQHDAVSHTLLKSAQRSLAGSQHGPREGAGLPPHTGNPIGHIFNSELQQRVFEQIFVKSTHCLTDGSQHSPVTGDSQTGNPVGHVFSRELQQLTPGQRRLKSVQDCFDGSQHVVSLDPGEATGDGASHVGNPVGQELSRVLQQLTPGQMRLKSEQDCFAGSQHVEPGAGVIVGVEQIGAPVGHFVSAELQQSTDGS
jgi:hypothetical protein